MALWNQFRTEAQEGMTAETISIKGNNGDQINAYYARPTGNGPFPGVVLINHLPGWDEFYRETTRRFAAHGYAAICPNMYARFGPGTPDDVAAKARGEGGMSDIEVVGDAAAAAAFLRAQTYTSNRVGVIGTCSGGRHSYLAACQTRSFDAIVNCWGGRVVMAEADLNPRQPVSPITLTRDLACPILGLFGNDDQNPTPEHVNQLEAALKQHGKSYEFHRYDGAGHGFFYYDRAAYRPEQAMDGWAKVFTFFEKNLS